MTLTNVIRGAGIALLVGFGLTACASNAPQSTTNDQPAAQPEQTQQFENAKDRVSCKSKKKHHKKAAAAEQQPAEQQQQ